MVEIIDLFISCQKSKSYHGFIYNKCLEMIKNIKDG